MMSATMELEEAGHAEAEEVMAALARAQENRIKTYCCLSCL